MGALTLYLDFITFFPASFPWNRDNLHHFTYESIRIPRPGRAVFVWARMYDNNPIAKDSFRTSNDILFDNDWVCLVLMKTQATRVTQPLFSCIPVILAVHLPISGLIWSGIHWWISALVTNGTCLWRRSEAGFRTCYGMQKACEAQPSTMAAILGLDDEKVEQVFAGIKNEIVVPANYNIRASLLFRVLFPVLNWPASYWKRRCEKSPAA